MKKKQTLSDRKREAIVNAAVTEFKLNGFGSTSMDKIAATASVSKRTVYNHFASKQVLFDEILGQLWRRSNEQIDYDYKPGIDLNVQLTQMLEAKLILLRSASYLDLARVVLAEMIHSPARAKEAIEQISEKEQGLNQWIKSAVKDNKLVCNNADFAAQQVHSLIKGSAFWPQVTMGLDSPDAAAARHIVDATVQMFLAQYGNK